MNRETLFEKMKLAADQEYEAYQLYKEISEKSGDPELKVIFERIAKEEWEHREIIMKRYKILKGVTE